MMPAEYDISGKVVFVTGAGRGIGKGIAPGCLPGPEPTSPSMP